MHQSKAALPMDTTSGPGAAPGLTARALAVLNEFDALSVEDQQAVRTHFGVQVALEAWDAHAKVPWGCAPAPAQRSEPAVCRAGVAAKCDASAEAVTGCPWCRRPVSVVAAERSPDGSPASPSASLAACAYVTLLYGPRCHSYFLGALVLGWGLKRHACADVSRLLLHTPDVPPAYVAALLASGWRCEQVEYISSVCSALFHNWRKSRFVDVFTKLRALQMTDLQKVLLLDLDLLVRAPALGGRGLECAFELPAPAAMKRGSPVPVHGERVPYQAIWEHPSRREGDELPPHQQASGINAGVVLLEPDAAVFAQMEAEVRDWSHPEHYATYMPEQEYLSRFYGTFDRWTHLDCRFNYEIDKNERVPHDWTEAHEAIRSAGDVASASGGSRHHPGVVVLHYSGTGIKPWDVLYKERGDPTKMLVASAAGVHGLLAELQRAGPRAHLDGYRDRARLWAAILEWLGQLRDAAGELAVVGQDPIALVRQAVADNIAADVEVSAVDSDG